jgi:sec-independent protein translocase protein TatA
MPFGLGIWELLILAGVLVLLFGTKGAPAMARRLGTGVRDLKDAVSEMDPTSMFDPKDDAEKPKARAVPALEAPSSEESPSGEATRVVEATPAVRVTSAPAATRDDIDTIAGDPSAR